MGLFSLFKGHKEPPTFNIVVKPEVLIDLKEALSASNKSVVRVNMAGFGWGGPNLDVVLDEQQQNDILVEKDGVKFVIEEKLARIVGPTEIVKLGNNFVVKKSSSYC